MPKFDGVIEAVRYKGGRIELVRAYERRGAAFSDHVLLDRATLLAQLKLGKRFVTGQRKPLMAGTFDVESQVILAGTARDSVITTPDGRGREELDGVPVF